MLLDGLDEGLVLLTPDGAVAELNPRAESLLGAPLARLIGAPLNTERAPGMSSDFVAWLSRAIATGQAASEVLPLAGGHSWVRVRVASAPDGLALFMVDVTESRVSRQSAVEASTLAQDLRQTLDRMGEAFYTLDADWCFTWVNAEGERLMRLPRAQLVGRSVWELFPDARGTIIETEFKRSRAEGVPVAFEVYFPPLSSWFEVRVSPAQGGIAVHFRDITQRRAAEERLLEQATLLDQAHDAIVVCDLQHRVVYWNQGAERCYGWTARDAGGRSVTEFLYADAEGDAFEEAFARVLAEGEWRGELKQRAQDGRTVVAECRFTLLRDGEGKARSVLSINTDVTEKRALERQFLRAQRLESLGTLAGGIAHDLNNVLAPIVMTASSLQLDEQDPERVEDLRLLQRSAERGADMVRQLLSFSRGADGQRLPMELKQVVMDVQQMVRETFPKNIQLQVRVPPGGWLVEGDRTQLHQVLTNLCVNARDAMPRGGTLSITLDREHIDDAYAGMNLEARPGPYVLVKVEDTGVGMSAEVLEHIFEPFFTTKEVGKGTGLGLSTVHALVKQHGGFINVYSEPGKGTRFKIYLPEKRADEQAAAAPEELPRGDGQLVLVVDDEATIRTVATRTLERYGYRVMVASNGAEAVALYAQHRGDIAVVLTDMTMPVMDGPATIVALRAIDPRVRIVGSSGLAANENVARAVDAGVQLFIPKPYTAEAMLKVLSQALAA